MANEDSLVRRVPPHSIEAEQSVIGSMLYSQDAIAAAAEMLKGEDFYQHQYGVIFDAIMELYQSGRPTDLVTLQDVLKTKDVAPEVYSIDTLRDLLNAVFTSANIRSYAKIVADKAYMRRMIKMMEGATNDLYLEKEDADALSEKVEKGVFEMIEKRGTGQSEDIRSVVLRTLQIIEDAAKNGTGITGIPTGFKRLDTVLSGLQPSDLILLAGRPSMGKTAFVLNLAHNFAVRNKYPTAVFELEMSKEQLVLRLAAMESQVDSQKLRTGQLSDGEWSDVIDGLAKIADASLFIEDAGGVSVADIRSKCRRYKLEKNLKVVIIDYLQLMSGSGSRAAENRTLEISEMTRSLKALARELNVPIILLSQLSRAPEQRTDHRPMLADLRESGAIEQDADVVMFIYRDEVYNNDTEKKGIAEIIIAKQRNGPTDTVELAWRANLQKFSNIEYQKYE